MMNTLILQARLIETPELKKTQSGSVFTNVRLAWNEKIKGDKEHKLFLNGSAWGKRAEFICNYFKKGDMVVVNGRLLTRSYEKDGETKYTTDLSIDTLHFCGNKKDSQPQEQKEYKPKEYNQEQFDMNNVEDLPF